MRVDPEYPKTEEVTDLVGVCEAGVQAQQAGGRDSEGKYCYKKHKEYQYKE